MIISNAEGLPVTGAFGGENFISTLPTSEKGGPSNRHTNMGETYDDTDGSPGGAEGRAWVQYPLTDLTVDRRVSPGGQTDVDFLDNFTLIQWINPCLLWERGWTWGYDAGHWTALWARAGSMDMNGIGVRERGWFWTIGGPPWFWGGGNPPPTSHINPGVNGFTFLYLPAGDLYSVGSPNDETFLANSYAFFWPYEYEQGLDASDGPSPFTGWSPPDLGYYCGWLFCALTVSRTYADSNAIPGAPIVVDAEMWVGQADQDNLQSLGVVTGPELRPNMWTTATSDPWNAEDLMLQINNGLGEVRSDDLWYEKHRVLGLFNLFDESRIYSRHLSSGEIKALYYHPGGQKRAENPLEMERQI
jgi:hypothetical protein